MFRSLRNRLTVIFVGLAIGPLLAVTIILTQQSLQILTQNALSAQGDQASIAAVEIREFIYERENELQLIMALGTDSEDLLETQSRLLQDLMVHQQAYRTLAILDPSGQEVYHLDRGLPLPEELLRDRSQERVFTETTSRGEVYYSSISIEGFSGEPLMSMALPLYDPRTSELEAIFVADFRFTRIWDLLASLEVDGSEEIYVVDSNDDRVIAHRNPSVVLTNARFDAPEMDGRGVGLSNEQVFLATERLNFGDQTFVVVVERPIVEALEIATNLLYIVAAITVIALVIAIVLVYITVRQIVRPVENLASVAQSIQKGNLRLRAEISNKDEIGMLARSFNGMTDQLQDSIENLEKRVFERTSELQVAIEEAERANRVKDQFLASMSHELRTPLNAIINFSQIMVMGVLGDLSDRQKSTLSEVITSAKHLLALINDILDISKIQAGMLTLFIEENVNVNTILDTVTSTAKTLVENGKKVAVIEDIDESLPPIVGDRRRLQQILLNLVSNAAKFTTEGSITVSAKEDGECIQFAVHDTGPGIKKEDMGRIFVPFEQTDSGVRAEEGTGLGLSITKSLVETHEGKLWVESAPGEGSAFFFTIPVNSATLRSQMA